MSDKKHTLLAGEMMWIPYCKAIALGGSYEAHCAKSCVAIGGETSGDSQGRTEKSLAEGRIDDASYRTRMEAIEIVATCTTRACGHMCCKSWTWMTGPSCPMGI